MSGLEVAAAIFGIIGGVASAYKLAVELRKRHQRRKNDKNATEERLRRVERQLKDSKAKLERRELATYPSGNHVGLNNMAIQDVLAVLQQLSVKEAGLMLDLGPLERYTKHWDREADLIAQSVCPNAIRYRRNDCRFEDVAVERVGGGNEWGCKLCGRNVSAATIPLSRGFSVQGTVHIAPNGCFKAHLMEGEEWACIWKERSEECRGRFGRRRELLAHMQSVHIRDDVAGKTLVVDGPADVRVHSLHRCGYGISILQASTEIEGDGFVVRYGVL
jgi:hypothetical protein